MAAETGSTNVPATEASKDADLVIVTIPVKALPLLPGVILEGASAGAPIVDTGNYCPTRDGRIEAIEDGMTESRWVSEQRGHSGRESLQQDPRPAPPRTGKTGRQARQDRPAGTGDDHETKRIVMELVDELGFDPIDAGTIDESWRQTTVYGSDLDTEGAIQALAEATRERPAR